MHHSTSADHVSHDLALIADHAAGDLSDSDRVRADALLSSCNPCADVRRDLVAIAAATRALPARAMPDRDFRLAPERAERLRRGSWLRAALRPFASSGSAVRPMAAAFTSLGLAGLLVAIVIPSLFGSAGAPADAQFESVTGPGASAGAAAPPAATQEAVAPQAAESSNDRAVDAATGAPGQVLAGAKNSPTSAPLVAAAGGETNDLDAPRDLAIASTGPAVNPLIAGSLGLLLVGLLLFGLRIASRRLR